MNRGNVPWERWREVGDRVFVRRHKTLDVNAGLILGDDRCLVVDTRGSEREARELLRAVRSLTHLPYAVAITHAHFDHCFGNATFAAEQPGCEIWAHQRCTEELARSGAGQRASIARWLRESGEEILADEVETVTLELPNRQLTSDTTLDLGGRRVEFRTWGTAHSPGDQIIHLPDEKIVFIGDLIEERMFPIVPFFPPMILANDIDVARWEMALNDVLALQPHLIVPGHGNLGGPEIATNLLGFFKEARAGLVTPGVPGVELDQRLRAMYPTWEHSEHIGPARQYFVQLPT